MALPKLTRKRSNPSSTTPTSLGTRRPRQRFSTNLTPIKSVPKQFKPSDYSYEPRYTHSDHVGEKAYNEKVEEERRQRLLREHLRKTGQGPKQGPDGGVPGFGGDYLFPKDAPLVRGSDMINQKTGRTIPSLENVSSMFNQKAMRLPSVLK